jgi:hypothetical protein
MVCLRESKFRLKHVESELEQNDYLLSALPEEIPAPVMDVLEDLPEDTPYSTLKDCLLKTHSSLISISWSSCPRLGS